MEPAMIDDSQHKKEKAYLSLRERRRPPLSNRDNRAGAYNNTAHPMYIPKAYRNYPFFVFLPYHF